MEKKSAPHFSPNSFSKKLASRATSRKYANGEAIFSQGDVANAMFRIERGNVKLEVTSKRSNKAAIAILRAGDCFGEGCCFGNALRTCTATSIQQSTIGRVSKRAMIRRLHDEPAFVRLFISYLLLRIGRVEDDLADQLVNSSERRVARLLLQLSDFGKGSGRAPAVMNVDQGTLAQVVGTTRSRVSHFMNQFRKQGFINYNGSQRVRVHKALLTFLLREHAAA
jgi:CRP/FNR family cyclic AMP-dependent transcriptional regulator